MQGRLSNRRVRYVHNYRLDFSINSRVRGLDCIGGPECVCVCVRGSWVGVAVVVGVGGCVYIGVQLLLRNTAPQ